MLQEFQQEYGWGKENQKVLDKLTYIAYIVGERAVHEG